MAPATVENASPIGIANVSMNRIHLGNEADILIASKSTVCFLLATLRFPGIMLTLC